jgi:phosphoglucosamine mutase
MGRLFGTDGARGVANTELTCELAMEIGRAAAMVLTEVTHRRARIVIGKDTRISSDMLESALIAGICSVGADALTLGVIPTPAVAYLVKHYGADAGVMISASHNPVEYNGIKIFNGEGYKLSDALEDRIESIVIDKKEKPPVRSGTEIGRISRQKDAVNDYIAHLVTAVGGKLGDGLRIAVDCANGSASATAPFLFANIGAECEIINASPDGTNINAACGSTHIEGLSKFVRENGCDIGVAFDGDADRCLAVDENGELIDGDKLIAIFAKSLSERDSLPHKTAVVTMLSNIGFFKFARENGINVSTTNVGDRNVLENMLANGYVLGGEQSGHIILLDHATTGDGELTAVTLLKILLASGLKASELAGVMRSYPQVMVNVTVGPEGKSKLPRDKEVTDAVKSVEQKLGSDGRVIVRASGTEPLIRVMLEGSDRAEIEDYANGLAKLIKTRLA